MSRIEQLTKAELERELLEGSNPHNSLTSIYVNSGMLALNLINLLRMQNSVGKECRIITPEAEDAIREWSFTKPDKFSISNGVALLNFEQQVSEGIADEYDFKALGMAVRTLELIRSLPDDPLVPMEARQKVVHIR